MTFERLCHENPDSCYTCGNAKINEADCIDCPAEKIQTLFEGDNEEQMTVEYKRAVEIAKNCNKFKELKLF